MPKRPRVLRSQRKIIGHFDVINPSAAGIDAGAEAHVVSVPEDRCEEAVRTFGTFTKDLHELAEWLIGLIERAATGIEAETVSPVFSTR